MMHQDLFSELDDSDRGALELAIQMMLREADDVRVEQARSLIASDWLNGAQFCSRHQQRKALALKPWEFAPCELGSERMEQFLARGEDHPQALHRCKRRQRIWVLCALLHLSCAPGLQHVLFGPCQLLRLTLRLLAAQA